MVGRAQHGQHDGRAAQHAPQRAPVEAPQQVQARGTGQQQRQPAAARQRQHRGVERHQRRQARQRQGGAAQVLAQRDRLHGQHGAQQQRQVAPLDGIGLPAREPRSTRGTLHMHLPQRHGARAQAARQQPPELRPWPGRGRAHEEQACDAEGELGRTVPRSPQAFLRIGQEPPENAHAAHGDRKAPGPPVLCGERPAAQRAQRPDQQQRRAVGIAGLHRQGQRGKQEQRRGGELARPGRRAQEGFEGGHVVNTPTPGPIAPVPQPARLRGEAVCQ